MSRRSYVILAGVLAVLLLLAFSLLFTNETGVEAPAYSLAKITRGNITAEVSATGTLSPVITVQVGSQVSGTIQHLYADFNSVVKKGEVIAQIDPAIFSARLAEAKANLVSARASRDRALALSKEASNNLSRVDNLYKKKLASEDALDTARFSHQVAVAEHRMAESAVVQAQAVLEREQVNLAYTSIYAPIDGVVISRNVDVGQTVAASLQAPTLFTIAQDLTRMQIETDVDEAFIGMIQQQQPVHFTVFAYQDRQFSGRVAQIRLQPKVEAGVVKYNCIINVDNSDLALKPGMTATVAIEVAHSDNILKAPNGALRFVPNWPAERLKKIRSQLQANEAFVWLVDGEQLSPVKVQLGIASERETEIRGENIQQDMAIAVPATRQQGERRRRFGLSLF